MKTDKKLRILEAARRRALEVQSYRMLMVRPDQRAACHRGFRLHAAFQRRYNLVRFFALAELSAMGR